LGFLEWMIEAIQLKGKKKWISIKVTTF
jgi:hypothetical protein